MSAARPAGNPAAINTVALSFGPSKSTIALRGMLICAPRLWTTTTPTHTTTLSQRGRVTKERRHNVAQIESDFDKIVVEPIAKPRLVFRKCSISVGIVVY